MGVSRGGEFFFCMRRCDKNYRAWEPALAALWTGASPAFFAAQFSALCCLKNPSVVTPIFIRFRQA
jgi:hypothetical protein